MKKNHECRLIIGRWINICIQTYISKREGRSFPQGEWGRVPGKSLGMGREENHYFAIIREGIGPGKNYQWML